LSRPARSKLRARHIGDFTLWKEHDEYQKSFARVLRDLTVKKEWASSVLLFPLAPRSGERVLSGRSPRSG
jgi:hypothetical protein